MLRRTAVRRVSLREIFKTEGNPFGMFFMKEYFMFGFIGAFTFLAVFSVKEVQKAGPTELPEDLKELRRKQQDPRRPPWPLLHQRVVMMREGKMAHDDLALVWEQCKYYYAHDWLIPLELSQILKYTTGAYLQAYVPDPDQFRREIIEHLEGVYTGTIPDPSGNRINRDIQELISMAIDDLKHTNLAVGMTLVPTHT
jgi:hypothetical protein